MIVIGTELAIVESSVYQFGGKIPATFDIDDFIKLKSIKENYT